MWTVRGVGGMRIQIAHWTQLQGHVCRSLPCLAPCVKGCPGEPVCTVGVTWRVESSMFWLFG